MKPRKKKSPLKRILLALLCLILALVLVVGGYVLYIVLQYSRIGDTPLEVENRQPGAAPLPADGTFTALTWNIGFGAYDHDFSFFMDSGTMLDGTPVTGLHARAKSREIVAANTAGVLAGAQGAGPDFVLMQEVDTRSDRSFKIDQAAEIRARFADFEAVFASNFHSAYLAYPLFDHHGAVQSGILSLSRYGVAAAERRELPVDGGFPTKFFDLDRCFSMLRLPVAGSERQLVLVNVHMSAFDEGGLIRAAQMQLLGAVAAEEYAAGNWVVIGGDYNHALGGSERLFPSQQHIPEWVAMFDEAALPEGFSVVLAENLAEVPTCRSTDLPYEKGVNFEAVLDGFIVSGNVRAKAVNLDTNFAFSDHNPVLLEFSLEGA